MNLVFLKKIQKPAKNWILSVPEISRNAPIKIESESKKATLIGW